jgi:hypothetical protein
VALNYRTWVGKDVVLWPAGAVIRGTFHIPRIGPKIAQMRFPARLGWQANRLSPNDVMKEMGESFSEVQLFRSPKRRPFAVPGASDATFEGIDPSHWWLIATVR